MKSILLLVSCIVLVNPAFARHGKGGSITYEYLGKGSAAGTSKYRMTVKHYIDCDGTQFIEPASYLGIFDAGNNNLVKTLTIQESSRTTIQKQHFDPCISQPPRVCYVVVTYVTEFELADNVAGYVLSEQECCRIGGIINIGNSSAYGITNTNIIPGVIGGVIYRTNSSPVFMQKDTVVICHDSYFSMDFSATDADGDKLTYAFSSGKNGGTVQIRQPNPPSSPPYTDLPYVTGYSAAQPLGQGVTIDAKTGIISGIAPSTLGSYIISVNISEFRNGILIGISKKEVQVTVADCTLSAASLKESYNKCKDFTFQFHNESFVNNVSKYYWDFGVPNSSADTSTAEIPTYTYPDTGKYILKLVVASEAGCEDSATANVLVYPGFDPGFTFTGSCFQTPFQFSDITVAQYGSVNSWLWDFEDNYASSNSSANQNPSHQYSGTGSYQVVLTVGSSKGCVDTSSANIKVLDKPFLSLPFRDTLICSIDTLALHARGSGLFSWTPTTTMLNDKTASPLVFPKATTMYMVSLNAQGCTANDSVIVNVLDNITVNLPPDTTICRIDSFQLRPVSVALQYQWLPNTGLNNAFIKNPKAAPRSDIRYMVIASLGNCKATSFINVKVVPYPEVTVSIDTTICYGTFAQLNASMHASSFAWTPIAGLQNANTLSPVARPAQATSYILTVYDTLGCPKPSKDTVLVSVLPHLHAFAGNDTMIVSGQPLQLNATGGTSYLWSPTTSLSNVFIANPVATINAPLEAITYMVRVSNGACFASDSINVKIFKTSADMFVPSAFTPNDDGKNDVLKPILVGIKKLEAFKIFNRWGQLVFSTDQAGEGWNGNVQGIPQQSSTFVYVAIGTTYLEQKIVRKGTVILIR